MSDETGADVRRSYREQVADLPRLLISESSDPLLRLVLLVNMGSVTLTGKDINNLGRIKSHVDEILASLERRAA